MVGRAAQKISLAVTCNAVMLANRCAIAGMLASCVLCGLAHSDQIPGEVFLDPVSVQKVRSLYQQRDNTLKQRIKLITMFYAEILPDRNAKKLNEDRALRLVAEMRRSNFNGLDVRAAHNALADARAALANDRDYDHVSPIVAETQAQIAKIYLDLRQFLPKSPNDPLLDAITAAFESGCDSPYAPIEAHLLSAMSASYGGQLDSAIKHLQLIQSEQLFTKWPAWPGLAGDFCVTCTLLDSTEICETQQKLLEGWKDQSDDPHVLWSIAMCRALSRKGSPDVYFRKAVVAFSKGEGPASLMEGILFDCLAYTAFSRETLPKMLKELSESQVLESSGLSQALFARAALAEGEGEREQLLKEGLRRCPPDARKIIAASFRATGEPQEEGGVKEPKVPVGLE